MIAKRLMDLALTIPGLIILSPLLLFIALWIKYDSKGPVFFKQKRVGLKGNVFDVYKFRTMVTDAEKKGLQITTGGDSRIIGAGAFLRKYKLDELAQLFNVLKGEMSLVGPRPEVPRYVALYPEDIREIVLSVKPGITDRASIEYKDENDLLAHSSDPEKTYVEEILPVKLRYYVEYVHTQSLIGDVRTIWDTITSILFSRSNRLN